MDRYAALSCARGATLSTDALRSLGGEASSLRLHARRLFGSFAAFQAAVVPRHPDIPSPNRPVAKDGRLFNSWSEVAAYHALRALLPEQPIAGAGSPTKFTGLAVARCARRTAGCSHHRVR